jgi:hypothetical protein
MADLPGRFIGMARGKVDWLSNNFSGIKSYLLINLLLNITSSFFPELLLGRSERFFLKLILGMCLPWQPLLLGNPGLVLASVAICR